MGPNASNCGNLYEVVVLAGEASVQFRTAAQPRAWLNRTERQARTGRSGQEEHTGNQEKKGNGHVCTEKCSRKKFEKEESANRARSTTDTIEERAASVEKRKTTLPSAVNKSAALHACRVDPGFRLTAHTPIHRQAG